MTLGQGRSVSLVCGTLVDRDAISNIVIAQRALLIEAGFDVRVFTQHAARCVDGAVEVRDPWVLLGHPHFAASELVVYHVGMYYELLNSLVPSHPRARRVLHFHNITPPALLDGASRQAAIDGMRQLALASNADRVWCDSSYNVATLLESADVAPDAIRVLEPWLPVEPDIPAHGRGHRATPHVLAVGRFVRAKGVLDLLSALELLDPELRGSLRASLAGSSGHADDGYLEQVRAHAGSLGVDVHLDLGDEELLALYAGSDLFVSPSHHEGFCLPVIEALSTGCRVVTTDAGALPDTVGGCGTVVAHGDIPALSAAIADQLRDLRSPGDDPTAADAERARLVRTRQHLRHFGPAAGRRRFLHEVCSTLALGRATAGPPSAGVITPEQDPAGAAQFAAHQARLLERLACPSCRGALEVATPRWTAGALESGGLECAAHGLVGVVGGFTPSFLDRELDRVHQDGGVLYTELDLDRDVTLLGDWTRDADGVRAPDAGAAMVFDVTGPAARLRVGEVGAGHRVDVVVDDHPEVTAGLQEEADGIVELALGGLGDGRHRAHLVATGAAVVTRIEVEGSGPHRPMPGMTAVNRGNPYPDRFAELLAGQAPDAMVLDCGGGDRRFGDARVYNLEYLEFDLPDLFGDGLRLPFLDDTFDLIMSQAVLEHVPDPQRAVDELIRVLKPGGQVYLEIAFMQPLHAVPSHYMNVTPHGIRHLCRELEVIDSGTFGGLAFTLEWIGQLAGAEARIGAARFQLVLDALRDIDQQLTPEELDQFASAVYLLGQKPAR